MSLTRVAWLVVACVACQGGAPATSAGSGTATASVAASGGVPVGSGAVGSGATGDGAVGSDEAPGSSAPSTDDDHAVHGKSEEPEPVDVGKAIAELGTLPAWQAAVERAQYLARRGQHGVVFGTLGAAVESSGGDAGVVTTPYTWLVDDTEGNGALAIRVALDAKAADLKAGDRVALGGTWSLDASRTWFWKVDAVSPLPAVAASEAKDPRAAPGHVIGSGDLPAGAKPISKADEGDLVWFQLVGAPPASDGDGWPVADELGNPVYALLDLPGEHASYGEQDMLTADERWHLKRGSTYVLRIGVVHKHGPDKPATIRARTAPVRVK